MGDDWRDRLRGFAFVCLRRLANGAKEYGDSSLGAHPSALLRELRDEAADLACWGYLLWRRIDVLRREIEKAEHCPLCGARTVPMPPPKMETVVI